MDHKVSLYVIYDITYTPRPDMMNAAGNYSCLLSFFLSCHDLIALPQAPTNRPAHHLARLLHMYGERG